ncbi:M56 family metallopeptidase [Micromonospora sp. NPDC049559]|uniref:M56 family metallopeptidase n=1 Tax=Micromonospora sp. NPDC049559 TaxID=3155923 RepID=UPI00344414BC
MIAALVLLAYAVVLAAVGPRPLARLPEQHGYPLSTVAAWYLAGTWAAVAAASAVVLLVGLPPHADGRLVGLLPGSPALAHHPHEHLPELTAPVALAVGAAALARLGWVAVAGARAQRRARRRHLASLRLLGGAEAAPGVHVLPAATPAVYCLGGRRPVIVATTGALRALTGRQLAAVLEHERCHLRERHHLLILAANLAARAFPFVPLLVAARERVPALLELRADDVAARRHGPRALVEALAVLATARPAAGLAAGGPGIAARAQRLLRGGVRPKPWRLIGLFGAVVLGPLSALVVPFCW